MDGCELDYGEHEVSLRVNVNFEECQDGNWNLGCWG